MKKKLPFKSIWKYYNLELNPYLPVESIKDKFSPDILLKKSFSGSSCEESFRLLIGKIQDNIGQCNSAWKIKLERGVLTWELYFYRKNLKNSMKEIKNILKVLRSHFKIPKLFAETCLDHQQWHILSVDLNEDALKYRKVQGLHISVYGGAGDGLTYYWDHKGCSLENQYDYSFNMPEDTDKFINRVRKTLALSIHCSSFFKHNLVCTLMPCKFISFGSKRNCQGIYFSGIKFDQFLFFLEFFSYPEHIVDFIKSNNGKFGHLLYDVSFDCLLDPRKLVFSKSGFYAVF